MFQAAVAWLGGTGVHKMHVRAVMQYCGALCVSVSPTSRVYGMRERQACTRRDALNYIVLLYVIRTAQVLGPKTPTGRYDSIRARSRLWEHKMNRRLGFEFEGLSIITRTFSNPLYKPCPRTIMITTVRLRTLRMARQL